MKNLFVAAAMSVALFSGVAQAEKLAVIDLQKIGSSIPQGKALASKLKAEFAGRIAEIKELEKSLKKKDSDFKRDQALMTDDQKRAAVRELKAMDSSHKELFTAYQEDTQRRQMQEQGKIMQLVKKAAAAVAKRDGYDVVLPAQAVFYSTATTDISDKIIENMSKK